MATHLEDDVVRLRRWRASDAGWYVRCVRDDDVQRFTSEPRTLTTAAVAEAIVASSRDPQSESFLIADRHSGRRLGNIGLHHDDGVGDVSYWVAAEARGKGVASRALLVLGHWAFAHLELEELRLWTHAANTGSRAVAEHAGFHRDPARDRPRSVKGEEWPTVAYRRPRPRTRPRLG